MQPSATKLPHQLADRGGLAVRRWRVKDAALLERIVSQSADHLRPWMDWLASEPLSRAEREAWLRAQEREWSQGGDVLLGIFLDQRPVGSCGLHRRIAPDGLEIGYWIHPSFLRRGIATRAARLLTDAAFTVPEITHVEIHHDKANTASAGVPRRLGFALVREAPDSVAAPAEIGVECVWRMDRARWSIRST